MTATVERTNGGLIESCDVSVTPGLSPLQGAYGSPRVSRIYQEKKICPSEAIVDCNNSNNKAR